MQGFYNKHTQTLQTLRCPDIALTEACQLQGSLATVLPSKCLLFSMLDGHGSIHISSNASDSVGGSKRVEVPTVDSCTVLHGLGIQHSCPEQRCSLALCSASHAKQAQIIMQVDCGEYRTGL